MRPSSRLNTKRGVLSFEYALLITIIAVGLMAMAAYLMRSLSGKFRETGDSFGHSRQFQRGVTTDGTSVIP